jgi:aspartyl protease family protein
MSSDQFASLAYFALLAIAVGGWFVVQNRGNWGRMAQQASVWLFIFLGAIAAFGLWNDIQREVAPRQSVLADNRIELPRRPDGHYHLTLLVNGVAVEFVVDTGASQIVLTRQDAERIGIDISTLRFVGSANTANGSVLTAPVRLDRVEVGQIRDQNLRAVVNGGEMDRSLLGMTYLGLFSSIEISGGTLVLTR